MSEKNKDEKPEANPLIEILLREHGLSSLEEALSEAMKKIVDAENTSDDVEVENDD